MGSLPGIERLVLVHARNLSRGRWLPRTISTPSPSLPRTPSSTTPHSPRLVRRVPLPTPHGLFAERYIDLHPVLRHHRFFEHLPRLLHELLRADRVARRDVAQH